jgi:hypothetical protein
MPQQQSGKSMKLNNLLSARAKVQNSTLDTQYGMEIRHGSNVTFTFPKKSTGSYCTFTYFKYVSVYMPNNLYMFPCMTPLQSGNKKPEVATLR